MRRNFRKAISFTLAATLIMGSMSFSEKKVAIDGFWKNGILRVHYNIEEEEMDEE